ncbi:hypothetical protein ElyMa_001460300 [Elysia marginata]|uniref:Uncharacterized protein n=1 Tax=Elysia marginata TaxID=1093978 RepID=A0AAV4J3A9_9GAST|nr:hypothetical protein ElyMa_001460300 [Elysia marginata]
MDDKGKKEGPHGGHKKARLCITKTSHTNHFGTRGGPAMLHLHKHTHWQTNRDRPAQVRRAGHDLSHVVLLMSAHIDLGVSLLPDLGTGDTSKHWPCGEA